MSEQTPRTDALLQTPLFSDIRRGWKDALIEHARQLERELAECRADAERLKKRAKNQRRELRRLNKHIGFYNVHFMRGLHFEAECKLRGIMNKTFGHEKVHAAEIAAVEAKRDE